MVRATQDISHLAGQLANLFRDNPQGTEIWANVFGAAGESLTSHFRSTRSLDLGNPEIYLEFFQAARKFAIFPRAWRHVYA